MKITAIKTTPLLCKFKQPYHWSQGINYGAPVILIEVETDKGIVGIGEATASPVIAPVLAIMQDAIPRFNNRLREWFAAQNRKNHRFVRGLDR